MTHALAALLGLLVGGLAGFVVAIAQRAAMHARNARLVRAGESPRRDAARRPWHLPFALIGAIASGAGSFYLPLSNAVLFGSLALPALLFVLFALGAIAARLRP